MWRGEDKGGACGGVGIMGGMWRGGDKGGACGGVGIRVGHVEGWG